MSNKCACISGTADISKVTVQESLKSIQLKDPHDVPESKHEDERVNQ